MTYKKLADGSYLVHGTKKDWIVSDDMKTCNCPKFQFMLKGEQPCHHIIEVREREKEVKRKVSTTLTPDRATEWNLAEYEEPLQVQIFVDKYGEAQLDHLLQTFEVIVIRDRVRVL